MNIFKKLWHSVRKIIKNIYKRLVSSENHVNKKDRRAKSTGQSTGVFGNEAFDDGLQPIEDPVDQEKTTSKLEPLVVSASPINELTHPPKEHAEDIETVETADIHIQDEANQQGYPTDDREEIIASTTLPELVTRSEAGELPKREKIKDISSTDTQLEPDDIPLINQETTIDDDNPQEDTNAIQNLEQKTDSEDLVEDFEKNQPIKPAELEFDEEIKERFGLPDTNGDNNTASSIQEQQIKEITDPEINSGNLEIVEPIEQKRPKQKRNPTRGSTSEEPWSPGNYYREFVIRRILFQELTNDEIDEFLNKLEQDEIDDILDWSMMKTENYLIESLNRVHLIGELPISKAAFNKLCEYNQHYPGKRFDRRLSKQKTIPPAFFITMMVFCARYSEEDARNFWRPYTQLVWGYDEADLSFQNVCRDHFRACREDLANSVGLNFLVYRPGDVVLPVYQHAIIPYHLMEHMAEWIVKKFEIFIQFDSDKLQLLISNKDELQYLPHQLQRFLTAEDTSESAATLLSKMSDAIAIFKEKKSNKLVETIIDSPIEKSLWNAIYDQLMVDKYRVEQIVSIKPKLDWIWDVDEEELKLRLSGVQSPQDQRPNTLYIISGGSFKTASYKPHLRPWPDEEKGWVVEKPIPSDALIDNDEIYVLSDKFDLDKSPEEQQACVLYNHKIPELSKDFIFFRHSLNRNFAREKETIDSNGDWIIISKTDFDLLSLDGESIPYAVHTLPQFLRKSGFRHVRKYELDLPIIMICDEEETQIQLKDGREYLDPILEGDYPIPGLSNAIPPVFQTRSVYLNFELDPQYPFRKTYFSIGSKHSQFTTVSFTELERNSQLIKNDSSIRIALKTFIDEFGQYQIDIIHGLRSLLDEPVEFGYLAEIKILPPDMDITFSPKRPFQVEIRNVKDAMLDYPEDIKLLQDVDYKVLKWKLHKSPECRFSINDDHGGHLELLWVIDRVTAWVEGGFNKNLIQAGQENNAFINVRGKPYQEFDWIINDKKVIPDKLDVNGRISNTLRYIKIRDSLRETKTSLTHVEIKIEDMRWPVFNYIKKPSVTFKEINYENGTLNYKLKIRPKLIGQYQFQLKKKGVMAAPVAVKDIEKLQEEGQWKIELSEGDYVIEIHLDNELLAVSERFSYSKPLRYRLADEKTKSPKDEDISVKAISLDEISAESLFDLLTAEKSQLTEFEQKSYSKIPYFQQLVCINDKSYWYIDGKVENGIKNLLPFWAVTKHPFRFVERKFHKTLIIYPAETALGGKVGKGHTYLKVNNQSEIVCAIWKPDNAGEYVKLVLGFPDKNIDSSFFKLSEIAEWNIDYTRPAYQCIDCGDLLGSGLGGFPPNIFNQHLHGKQRKAYDQFIDTRHKESLKNTLSVYQDNTLDFEVTVSKSIMRNCLKLLENYPKLRKHGELSKPIVTANNLDYSKAFTELFENYKQGDNKDAISFFMDNKDFFDDLDKFLFSLANNIFQISAMERLADILSEEESFCEIPKFCLSLCTLLRLKAHFDHIYLSYLTSRQIEESRLMMMVYTGMQGFPKFIEWSIAWAEIFFVHAIS